VVVCVLSDLTLIYGTYRHAKTFKRQVHMSLYTDRKYYFIINSH